MPIIACPDCDLLQTLPEIPPGCSARCPRCARTLASHSPDPVDRPLALSIAALLVLIIANTAPLMGLSVAGRQSSTTILGGAYQMWLQGQEITALIVACCAVLAPTGYILFTLAMLLGARRSIAPAWVGKLLRWIEHVRPWSMTEVMMLGILVALIKIAQLAQVEPGIGMIATGVLMLLIPAIEVSVYPDAIWERITWANGDAPPGAGEP